MEDTEHEGIIGPGQTLVCIGDSITQTPDGYVTTVRDVLALRFPDNPPQVINAGIGANTVGMMLARFETDVLSHNPAWVSIMAGVADTIWEVRGQPNTGGLREGDTPGPERYGAGPQQFANTIRQMIEKAHVADVGVILCTPSHLEPAFTEGLQAANQSIAEKTRLLHELAQTGPERIVLVPTGEVLLRAIREAGKQGEKLTISPDGVHPDEFGHALMALTLLAALGYEMTIAEGE